MLVNLASQEIEAVDVVVLVSGAIFDGRRPAAALAIDGAGWL
jgi:NAD(P)H-dependent flavin oxidoreductase YrpB (nitropropane dioxygenase family)